MPALPATPSPVIRVKLVGLQGANLDVSVRFYLAYTGTAPTNAQCATFAGNVGTEWAASMAPYTNSDFTATSADVEDVSILSGGTGAGTFTHVGTQSGTPLGGQVASLINFGIARRYRGGKPRVYHPAGSEAGLASINQWSTTQQTNVNAAWTSFINALIGVPWSGGTISGQVNVSYYAGFASYQNPVTMRWKNLNTPRATPVVDTITSHSLNLLLGTQRRRISA